MKTGSALLKKKINKYVGYQGDYLNLFVYIFGVYDIWTFVGYWMPSPFLYK